MTLTPEIVDWIEDIEQWRINAKWEGEEACWSGSIEMGLPGDARTELEKALDDKMRDWHRWKLQETMENLITREAGGLVRWAPAWLSTEPKPPEQEVIHLSGSSNITILAHAVSSVQNLEIKYTKATNTLTLVAEKIGTFAVMNDQTSDTTRTLWRKAEKEGWWRPNLAAVGIPCNLVINLPIVRVTVDETAAWTWWPHGTEVFHHRVDPGHPEGWR